MARAKPKLPDYAEHPCGKCAAPAFGYMRSKVVAVYLCERHFWLIYNNLFVVPIPVQVIARFIRQELPATSTRFRSSSSSS